MSVLAARYRADGMRVQKFVSGGDDGTITQRFYHDGQMLVEEDQWVPPPARGLPAGYDVTRYGLGARGIDLIAKLPYMGSEVVSFPIYDGHGNLVATLRRDLQTNGFFCENRKAFDAWGMIRQGSVSGDPKPKCCANLGHVQDDESGLTYMRARYYEPSSGRFVSEDPAMAGANWYVYCKNSPTNLIDRDGKNAAAILTYLAFALGLYIWINTGYGLMSLFFQAMNPGYKATQYIDNALLGLASFALPAAAELMKAGVAQLDIKKIANVIRRSLSQTGGARYLGAFGVGFGCGLIVGIAMAIREYMLWELNQEDLKQ